MADNMPQPPEGFQRPGIPGAGNIMDPAVRGEIRKIVQSPDIQEKFAGLGLDATGSTPERFKEIMRAQIQTLAKIIKDAGVKTE